jgi:hypothetical protein
MKNLFIILSFVLSIPVFSQTVTIGVDITQNRKNISPYIYGRNNSLSDDPSEPLTSTEWQKLKDAGIKLFRENGGNNATKYNWRLKLSSHPDWYNNVYPHDWDFEAQSLQQNIPGAKAMYSFQLIGKAASNKNYNFNDWAYDGSSGGNNTANWAGGGGPVSVGGNGGNGNINLYLKDWTADSTVDILDKWFGNGSGSLNLSQNIFQYWNMDNEPEIWDGTHNDVMPVQLSAEAFMQRYFTVAKKVRAKYPDMKLVGFVPCSEWFWFAYPDGTGDSGKIPYKGSSYTWIEYFIMRIGEEQQSSGIKLLDVIDLHTYLDASSVDELLQVHRVFYDRNFNYPHANGLKLTSPNGWDENITKEYIFGRINDWLTQYLGANHGVTCGSTESGWNNNPYDNIPDFNQMELALNYASTLGVFANEGVELFTPWYWSPSYWEVVHLFSRYSKTISVKSTSSDDNYLSAYSTVNAENDSLTVVLVNRYNSSRNAQVSLSNFNVPNNSYQVYTLNGLPANNSTETFVSHTTNALHSSNVTVTNGVFTIPMPARSIVSVVLKGTSGPYLNASPSTINLASAAGSTGTITVSSNVSWTAASNQTWLTVNPTSGANSRSVTVTASVNSTGASRSATVTISGTGVTSKTITVTQAPPASLTVDAANLNVNAAANSNGSVNVTSNIAWSASSNQTWLTVLPTSGSGNAKVTVTAGANPTVSARTATVTVSGSGITRSITVTQAAGAATLTVNRVTLNVNAAANSKGTIAVTSNTTWLASSNQAWLTVLPAAGTGNVTITVTAAANSGNTARVATVTVSRSGITRTITVTQAANTSTDIEDIKSEEKIYPNPFSKSIVIELKHTIIDVTVYDLKGNLLKKEKINSQKTELNLFELPTGIYILKINTNNGILEKKIMKE